MMEVTDDNNFIWIKVIRILLDQAKFDWINLEGDPTNALLLLGNHLALLH